MASLVVGFFASAVGVFYANHWTRSPRADEVLDSALKGISNHYHIYHYLLPVQHVLIGPAGVFVFRTYAHEGPITYDGKKWKQKFKLIRALGFSGQESLADPVRDALYDVERFRRWLAKRMPEDRSQRSRPTLSLSGMRPSWTWPRQRCRCCTTSGSSAPFARLDKECAEPLDKDTLYDARAGDVGDRSGRRSRAACVSAPRT